MTGHVSLPRIGPFPRLSALPGIVRDHTIVDHRKPSAHLHREYAEEWAGQIEFLPI